MNKRYLVAILIATLAFRLFLALSTPNLTYDSYFHLRQVEHIAETGLPLFDDPLSYGGREIHFLPLFHYLMAALSLVIPLSILAKIAPNLLMATLPLLVYALAQRISKNQIGALLAAGISGFLPILYQTNAFTPLSLFFPLLFFTVYAFLSSKSKSWRTIYLISFAALSMTSGSTALLVFGFGIYLTLAYIEGKQTSKIERELMIYAIFTFAWLQIIFFKKTLLQEGITFIWRNLPPPLLEQYFPSLSIGQSVIFVSVIPFVCGLYVVYKELFKLKNTKAFFLISCTISTTILVWLQLLEFTTSLAFFGLIMAILFARFYEDMMAYLKATKIPLIIVTPVVIALLVATMIIPAYTYAQNQAIPTIEDTNTFMWIKNNTPTGSGIAALPEEGHLVTYISERRNLMDDQYYNIADSDVRFKDLSSLYTTQFSTQAVDVLASYDMQYLVLTQQAQKKFQLTKFPYAKKPCFDQVLKNETRVYATNCAIGPTK